MDEQIIKPFEFIGRINKYVLIPYYLDYLARNGNLKEQLLKVQMLGYDQKLDFTSNIWQKNSSIAERIKGAEEIKVRIEKQYQYEIDNYFPILYNQALIISCTIFDLFLADSLSKIIKQKNALKLLASKEDITIYETIDHENYESIISDIQNKVLKRFDFLGIEKKIKILKNLGLDTDLLFELKLHKAVVQDKYPNALKLLLEIYEMRNDIVHRNSLPIKQYEELSDLSSFLQSLIMEFAQAISNQFKIATDYQQPYQQQKKG